MECRLERAARTARGAALVRVEVPPVAPAVVAEVVAQLGRRHQRIHLVEHERVEVGSE